jgi:hypothetical protein
LWFGRQSGENRPESAADFPAPVQTFNQILTTKYA